MLWGIESWSDEWRPRHFVFVGRRGETRVSLWIFRMRTFLRYEPRGRYVCDLNIPGPLDVHALAIRRNRRRSPNRCASPFSRRAAAMSRTIALLAVRA